MLVNRKPRWVPTEVAVAVAVLFRDSKGAAVPVHGLEQEYRVDSGIYHWNHGVPTPVTTGTSWPIVGSGNLGIQGSFYSAASKAVYQSSSYTKRRRNMGSAHRLWWELSPTKMTVSFAACAAACCGAWLLLCNVLWWVTVIGYKVQNAKASKKAPFQERIREKVKKRDALPR